MPSCSEKAQQVLKRYFGFDNFRALQKDIIDTVLQSKDLLVLMPTGGGKSLCYQVPALVFEGVTIVVSPLIALMEDQVAALTSQGIQAAYYNSSLSVADAKQVLAKLHHNELDLLYIAPERLLSPSFLERLKECDLSLFAIDEAHCISQWGHDFRPEYAALGVLKTEFPHVPMIALTATADQQTRLDIIKQLGYAPQQFIASFNRPNIYYRVLQKTNPLQQILHFLKTQPQQSGIIYCGTRNGVERLSLRLQEQGLKVRGYHAGLSYQERREAQTLFRHDHIDIVVATIAFGMGIDKPNVRFVVHYDLPKNIESYYQETGRAGRDGLPASALLLYNPADSGRLRGLIATISNETQQRIETSKLNYMLAFADATQCRRKILLQYFNETTEAACNYCDQCDNPPVTVDATQDAQKLLSCLYRVRQNYGMNHVIEVLRGSNHEKIKQFGHHKLSTFGIGSDKSVAYWKQLAWHLMHNGYCYQDFTHYNVLRLTQKASEIFKGLTSISIALPNPKPDKKPTQKRHKTFGVLQDPLFELLRKLRRDIAEEEEKPPFMIFSDSTLAHMSKEKPQTSEDLLAIPGVGQHKLSHYGYRFLSFIRKATQKI